jgi:hypothetical protein
MGLDTTHGAFHGAYSAFNRFRQVVAKAMGGSWPPHEKPLVCSDGDVIVEPDNERFYVPGKSWSTFQIERPGLSAFIGSQDCEGIFSPDTCKNMADELEALLPAIERVEKEWVESRSWGHIARDGGFVEVTKRYIEGCRLAHSLNEDLEYH